MATRATPQMIPAVFANPHNLGQRSTRHRSVEVARIAADKAGPDPEKGQFWRDYEAETAIVPDPLSPGNKMVISKDERQFVAPSGKRVVVKPQDSVPPPPENPAQRVSPHDIQVAVDDLVLSEPAAKIFLNKRYGIQY